MVKPHFLDLRLDTLSSKVLKLSRIQSGPINSYLVAQLLAVLPDITLSACMVDEDELGKLCSQNIVTGRRLESTDKCSSILRGLG